MKPLAFAALLLVLVSGCAPTRALPPQPSGDELDALIAIELDYQWQYVGLTPDSPRPTAERVRVVSMDEAEAVHQQCMDGAGYEGYRQGTAMVSGSSNAERLALYTCLALYPVAPSNFGILSEDQLRFLYDYYQMSAIPCLRANGATVVDVPGIEDFLAGAHDQLFSSAWSPYDGLGGPQLNVYILSERCPNYPEGFLGR